MNYVWECVSTRAAHVWWFQGLVTSLQRRCRRYHCKAFNKPQIYCLRHSIAPPHLQCIQPVLGVTNKGCTPSWVFVFFTDWLFHRGHYFNITAKVLEPSGSLIIPPPHPAIQPVAPLSLNRSSAWTNTHEQLLSPPKIKWLLLPLLTWWSSFVTGIELK